MKRKTLFGLLIASVAVLTQSCESDFGNIGSEIFGEDNFGFDVYNVQNISTSTAFTDQVSTRNLPLNSIGVFNDPTFGKTTAHFVTQIEMVDNESLTLVGKNAVIDSVYIYIPYNSAVKNAEVGGETIYDLKDVYGEDSFTLNVYENGYLLRNYNPLDDLDVQEYYSSDKPSFDNNKKGINGNRLNNSANTSQNTNFKFDKKEILLYKYDKNGEVVKDKDDKPVVKERKKPGMWLDLDKNYFQEKFFANNINKTIINNNMLKTYFRGLYFNVTNENNKNALAQLNIGGGELIIIYKQDNEFDATKERTRKTFKFKIGILESSDTSKASNATTVNLIENNFSTAYTNGLKSNNPIWIKGNNGSLTTISLFGADSDNNGVADELDIIKQKELLINQAVLTIYVDNTAQTNKNETQPSRLYLYDIKNNKPIADYILDASTNPVKNIYNGILETKKDEQLSRYRFRITDHINNLIKKDSTNVTLGLVVTNDIANTSFRKLKNAVSTNNTNITKIPTGAASSPFGTVLFGPNHTDKNTRMKLDIYYTKKEK